MRLFELADKDDNTALAFMSIAIYHPNPCASIEPVRAGGTQPIRFALIPIGGEIFEITSSPFPGLNNNPYIAAGVDLFRTLDECERSGSVQRSRSGGRCWSNCCNDRRCQGRADFQIDVDTTVDDGDDRRKDRKNPRDDADVRKQRVGRSVDRRRFSFSGFLFFPLRTNLIVLCHGSLDCQFHPSKIARQSQRAQIIQR